MRTRLLVAASVAAFLVPAAAHAQNGNSEVQGFGGMTFNTSSAFNTATAPTFGGRVAIGLTPNLQAIGEGGRLSDIKPPLLDLLEYTPVDLRVSAWYGEAGVRFLTSSHGVIRPYGEATAGFARLSTGLSGVGGRTGEVIDVGLNFFNRTEPMLGVGGGVLLQGGPLSLDIGYRYKKIMEGNGVASALNAGNPYSVNQVRIGLGVRF
jgi:Outer membrane protein beta-barrel domain